MRDLSESPITASVDDSVETLRALAEALRTPDLKVSVNPDFLDDLADDVETISNLCDQLANCVRAYYGVSTTNVDLNYLASSSLIAYHLLSK